MGRSKDEFLHSRPSLIFNIIDMYHDELQVQNNEEYQSKYFDVQEVRDITSMKEIEGW